MSFGADEEILQDFLIEAGELLEQLSEQLVELERSPDDVQLLNAIFRGFHTVKGGAGFLQINPLVDLCHIAENVFDALRHGQIKVSSELMDVVLTTLDSVNRMFAEIHNREMPESADNNLLENLKSLLTPSAQPSVISPAIEKDIPIVEKSAVAEKSSVIEKPIKNSGHEDKKTIDFFDDDLFDSEPSEANDHENEFLEFIADLEHIIKDQQEPILQVSGKDAPKPGDEISDEEFERLLDNLHGKGKGPTVGGVSLSVPNKTSTDEISDNEFEKLLDKIHGQGGAPGQNKISITEKILVSEKVGTLAKFDVSEKNEAIQIPTSQKVTEIQQHVKTPVVAKENSPAAETTVRVDTKRLDDIMNMVGELVLVRNRLVRLGNKNADEEIIKAVANLDVVTADLQTAVMKTRMQPIKKVFGRFPRVVRDLARSLHKEIELVLKGEETDLDKNLVEALADPLVHLVRNSVDHGIELPEDRVKAGKPRCGVVILSAEQEGDHIVLSISDDGNGMDADRLRKKAIEKGILDQEAADRLSNEEAYNLIFHAGFSTKEQISDVSGRGVGMDVVKTKINQLNGSIFIKSELGKGSLISIKVPLTLAIMPTLMVILQNQTFAFPLVSVSEIFHIDLRKINVVDGQEVVIVRGKPLLLFHLKNWLISDNDPSQQKNNFGHVVIINVGISKIGFVVDQLIGQEEVVIKPLGKILNGTAGMAGATITGDGRIALILDVPSMLKHYANNNS
ncbi:MAG: chemotaxis protein CheA [Pseudomonadota bacterium]